jgi:phage shock protein PspC (stress-responsive transcriptional regulator)
MERSNSVRLTGHEHAFLLDEEAYRRLDDYLTRARLRLQSDPDIEDVIADLERSIGERIADLEPTGERRITASDLEMILTEVGAVDLGDGKEMPTPGSFTTEGRFLCRIREGQDIAGVCNGLAAYADYDVSWVRTIFVLLALFTGGVFILVYVAMIFILPVVPTHADYHTLREQRTRGQTGGPG